MDVKQFNLKWMSQLNFSLFDEFLQPWVSSKRGQHFANALFYLLLLLNLWILYSIWQNWRTDHTQPIAHPVVTTSNALNTESLNALTQAHLFGETINRDELPITSLQLHLTGIMQDPERHVSQAIISSQGGPGLVYKVGDTLPSGIKVYAITRQEVILQRHNHLEKLPLIRQPLIFQGMPTPMN